MRILLTADPEIPVPPLTYGGIERIVDGLGRELRARGHTVGLVAHPDSTMPADMLFPWPGERSQRPLDTTRNVATLAAAVYRFRPDVLHSFSRALYMLPLLPTPVRKVMSYQRHPGKRQVASTSALAGRTLVFTGCSEHICHAGRVGGGTWIPIHNCVSLQTYTFQPAVAADAPLVFLSRVERLKGAHVAIAIARRTGRALIIAGNHGDSGDDGRYWESEIRPHLGLNGVEYVGPVDDEKKNALLGRAAAMVVPVQWEEPFGIVFAEALACGTPVISCPRGALPEIVRHGIDGYLINTVDEGCDAVEQLKAINRLDCRVRAETMFSTDVIVSQYESVYRSLRATS